MLYECGEYHYMFDVKVINIIHRRQLSHVHLFMVSIRREQDIIEAMKGCTNSRNMPFCTVSQE
jgi:hypothetical protein